MKITKNENSIFSYRLNNKHAVTLIKQFTDFLKERGHPQSTIERYVRGIKHFFQWMSKEEITPYLISKKTINQFYEHLKNCYCTPPAPKDIKTIRAALNHFLTIIQKDYRFILLKEKIQASTKQIIIEYEKYLIDICGISHNTCIYRIRYIKEFLSTKHIEDVEDITKLTKSDFLSYISNNAKQCKIGTKKVIAGSLRSLIKFLQFKGFLDSSFLNVIPSIPQWKLASLPKTLSEKQLDTFLNSFDSSTPAGCRDYAMARCMIDLGLRASEVAQLELRDINWQEALIHIRTTKSGRDRALPLPIQLGQAIVKYLTNGRLLTDEKKLFIRHTVPKGVALNTEQVRGAMRRAYARAGFPKTYTGTHILRHTAATRMHQNGATIKQLADVLGHSSIDTSIIYTKTNITMLRHVVLPWPEVQ